MRPMSVQGFFSVGTAGGCDLQLEGKQGKYHGMAHGS